MILSNSYVVIDDSIDSLSSFPQVAEKLIEPLFRTIPTYRNSTF